MRKLFITCFISTLITAPALAEGNVIYAECGEGGCSCLLTDLTEEEARITLGEDPPEGDGEAVLVGSGGTLTWSRLSLEDIDLVHGGSGECELALFPAFVPADGSWVGTVGARTIGANCPNGVETSVNPMLDGILERRQMQWEAEFHPRKIGGFGPQNIQWTMVNENYFVGVMNMPNMGAAGRTSVNWVSELKSEDYVRSEVVMDILGICDVNAVVDFRRSGP